MSLPSFLACVAIGIALVLTSFGHPFLAGCFILAGVVTLAWGR